jgi:hypothetical protein
MLITNKRSQIHENAGEELAAWLNGRNYKGDKSDASSRTRMIPLVKCLRDLWNEYELQGVKNRYLTESKKLDVHRAAFNALLDEFLFKAYLDFREGYGPEWQFSGAVDQMPAGLAVSIANLISLFSRGVLMRLDTCRQCGKWFFAMRRGAKYCPGSGRCRSIPFQSTPEYKAKHAAREKERYHRARRAGKNRSKSKKGKRS